MQTQAHIEAHMSTKIICSDFPIACIEHFLYCNNEKNALKTFMSHNENEINQVSLKEGKHKQTNKQNMHPIDHINKLIL